VILALILFVQRRRLAGQEGVDIDALPGRSAHPAS
jgi:hypothetical protein